MGHFCVTTNARALSHRTGSLRIVWPGWSLCSVCTRNNFMVWQQLPRGYPWRSSRALHLCCSHQMLPPNPALVAPSHPDLFPHAQQAQESGRRQLALQRVGSGGRVGTASCRYLMWGKMQKMGKTGHNGWNFFQRRVAGNFCTSSRT